MDDPDVCDSENILEIARAPESLLAIGSGAAGCEYASIFAALGTRITIVGAAINVTYMKPRILVSCSAVVGNRKPRLSRE
jgi:pyruvate/2-oxoglutarate dehydrogenase complex dihydrolipoamide dehydrogenase (E3) component